MSDVYLVGAAMTRIGRREEGLPELMAEAAHGALRAASLERPEALVVSAMNPEEFVGEGNFASYIATYLGLSRVPSLRAETVSVPEGRFMIQIEIADRSGSKTIETYRLEVRQLSLDRQSPAGSIGASVDTEPDRARVRSGVDAT